MKSMTRNPGQDMLRIIVGINKDREVEGGMSTIGLGEYGLNIQNGGEDVRQNRKPICRAEK